MKMLHAYTHYSIRYTPYSAHYTVYTIHSGVPKPGVFWVLTPPTFWGALEMGVREGAR